MRSAFEGVRSRVAMARTATVFALSVLLWSVYFYLTDWLIMEGQGLPVGWNLMPVS